MREIKKAEAYDGSEYDLHRALWRRRNLAPRRHLTRNMWREVSVVQNRFQNLPRSVDQRTNPENAWFACAARRVNSRNQPLESRFVVRRAGAITVGGSRCLRENPRMGQIGHLGHQRQVVATEAG